MAAENDYFRIDQFLHMTRRQFVRTAGAATALAGMSVLLPVYARSGVTAEAVLPRGVRRTPGRAEYDLDIATTPFPVGRKRAVATTVNGTVPGPLLRFREGDDAIIRVRNLLNEDSSIHWHGLLVPPDMDGVPSVSFAGIHPATTFEYRFPIKQYGTYWYHSHSAFQEQLGLYGPLIVDPAEPDPYTYDREYVVMLSEWTFEDPAQVLDNLKKQGNYYNFQRRTVGDFIRDVKQMGLKETVRERLEWGRMRMDPTDILDVTGATYTYLLNGMAPDSNWTGLFQPGERIRLRFINAGAATTFDVRIPSVEMTVVHVSGQNVQPVKVDEFRIGLAETIDVIIEPPLDRPYTIFAEAADRSGFARGTLATRAGMEGPLPVRRRRPTLTMMDMGMQHEGMEMSGAAAMNHGAASPGAAANATTEMAGHDMASMSAAPANLLTGMDAALFATAATIRTAGLRPPGTLPNPLPHEADIHAPDNAAVPQVVQSRLHEPGTGLGEDGRRVLVYTDLIALDRRTDFRAPDREIEMHLTGNMERFMWSIDGVPFDRSEDIHFTYGERIRLTMVNDTMMQHPMHLHGMWMELENGHGEMIPRVHTINVKPAERISLLIDADAPGRWAFHCHVLYHMDVGMFRVVEVSQPATAEASE
jgi:CopA family copper-resistance protein